MVSQQKIKDVERLKEKLSAATAAGLVDLHKLPARQLHSIRDKIRGKATLFVAKKVVISRALEGSRYSALASVIQHEPALLLTNENPFALARILEASKSMARAKPGDRAPADIVIRAGPTPLPPGPAIGELQKMKIPAGVEGSTIAVKKDTVVARAGEAISAPLAELLGKLNIEPMEIGMNLLAVQEGDITYSKEILFVPLEHYLQGLASAHQRAVALSLSIGYITKNTIIPLISKASRQALALADAAAYPTRASIARLLAKAQAQAAALQAKTGN